MKQQLLCVFSFPIYGRLTSDHALSDNDKDKGDDKDNDKDNDNDNDKDNDKDDDNDKDKGNDKDDDNDNYKDDDKDDDNDNHKDVSCFPISGRLTSGPALSQAVTWPSMEFVKKKFPRNLYLL